MITVPDKHIKYKSRDVSHIELIILTIVTYLNVGHKLNKSPYLLINSQFLLKFRNLGFHMSISHH